MILYHGTVKEYLPSIMKEGLVPQKNVWQAFWDGGGKVSEHEKSGVYLASSFDFAKWFAETRVDYLRIKGGGRFRPTGNSKGLIKMKNAPVVITSPVVLRVEILERSKISIDPKCGGGVIELGILSDFDFGVIYRGTIPPQQLQVVHL